MMRAPHTRERGARAIAATTGRIALAVFPGPCLSQRDQVLGDRATRDFAGGRIEHAPLGDDERRCFRFARSIAADGRGFGLGDPVGETQCAREMRGDGDFLSQQDAVEPIERRTVAIPHRTLDVAGEGAHTPDVRFSGTAPEGELARECRHERLVGRMRDRGERDRATPERTVRQVADEALVEVLQHRVHAHGVCGGESRGPPGPAPSGRNNLALGSTTRSSATENKIAARLLAFEYTRVSSRVRARQRGRAAKNGLAAWTRPPCEERISSIRG